MKRVPLKALLIGILMCLVINVVMSYGVLAMGTFNWTGDFISGGAILLLFLLILVYNTPLALVRRQWAPVVAGACPRLHDDDRRHRYSHGRPLPRS